MRPILLEGDIPPELAKMLKSQRAIAVDTETSGLDWRTDKLQLCQLNSALTGPLLLRGVHGTPSALAEVFSDAKVRKVFHHAPFDLRFLEAQWGIEVSAVACTKAASKLLEPHLRREDHSLQSLLKRYLQVEVNKGSIRTSNWGSRSLSQAQIAYAVGDVIHLLGLFDNLNEKLRLQGLLDVWSRVCDYMPLDAHLEVSGVPNPLVY